MVKFLEPWRSRMKKLVEGSRIKIIAHSATMAIDVSCSFRKGPSPNPHRLRGRMVSSRSHVLSTFFFFFFVFSNESLNFLLFSDIYPTFIWVLFNSIPLIFIEVWFIALLIGRHTGPIPW